MGVEFKAKVFLNGRSRSIRIPVGIDLPGDEVIFRQEDGVVTLKPAMPNQSLIEWLATLEPIDIDWPEIEDPPPEPVDL